MTLYEKRLKQLTEQIIKESLVNGILPSSKEFIWKMNQALKKQNLHLPSYRYQAFRNSEVVESSTLNKAHNAIREDLQLLTSNIIDIQGQLTRYQNNFEVEKEKLETEITRLENELKEKMLAFRSAGYLAYAYDTFDNLNKVNKETSQDVFVDTKEKSVRLVEEKNQSKRLTPNALVSFRLLEGQNNAKEQIISGELSDLLNLTQVIPWQRQYSFKKEQVLTGELLVVFETVEEINRLQLQLLNIKKQAIKVEFSNDGQQWFDLPYAPDYEEKGTLVTYTFPTLKIKALRFYLKKYEADEVLPSIDGYDFKYLFGFQGLELYNKQYPLFGVFESQSLEIQHLPKNYQVDTVRLSVKEQIPTGSELTYEVAIDKEDERELDWFAIDPMERVNPNEPQVLHFSNLKRKEAETLFFPTGLSMVQSEVHELTKNALPIYRLSSMQKEQVVPYLPKKQFLKETMKLYPGKNAWEITAFPSNHIGIPTLDLWKKVQDETTVSYQVMDDSKTGDVFRLFTAKKASQYLCKTGLFLPERDQTIRARPIATEDYAIYLNGEKIHEAKAGEQAFVNFAFKVGWNELVLLVNGQNVATASGMSVSLGFNPKDLSTQVYASSKSMKQISVFDLQYNTKQNDRTVFALREVEGQIEVLLNFAYEGLAFDLFYDYADESSFALKPAIRLRATFRRMDGTNIPSPQLHAYRLEFS